MQNIGQNKKTLIDLQPKNGKWILILCYYFDYIIKLEDFDLDNILIDIIDGLLEYMMELSI